MVTNKDSAGMHHACRGPHCKGFRNAPLQQIEMGQSADLIPLVSLYIPKYLAIFKGNSCGLVRLLFSVAN